MQERANPHDWDDSVDDAPTRIYLKAPDPETEIDTDPGSMPALGAYGSPSARSFEVEVASIASLMPVQPRVEPAIPATPASSSQRPGSGLRGSVARILVTAACILVAVGVGVGGALAAGRSHATEKPHATVAMTPAALASLAAPAQRATLTIEPIVEPAAPPIVEPAAPPITEPVAEPAAPPIAEPAAPPITEVPTTDPDLDPLPAPQPKVTTPSHHHHARKAVTDREPSDGVGTLAVSSKPPCSIVIDGKDTGLMAPQRKIELAAGKHEITLINEDQGIHLTAGVKITADRSTKLIRDFTN